MSVALLEPAHPGDAIYAITDGAENSSRQSVEALRRRLIASGVYLSVILVPDFALLSTEERIFSQEFGRLSVETGGWTIMANAARLASRESERSRFAHTIRRTLAVRGVQLAIDLPEPIPKWREWKLEILTDQGKPDKKAQIAYPRFLQPCAEPQHSP